MAHSCLEAPCINDSVKEVPTTNHLMTGSHPVRGTFLGVPDVLRLDRYTRLITPAAWEHVLASASHLFFSVKVLDMERRHARLNRGDETYYVYCI